jgi:hypothetical protein
MKNLLGDISITGFADEREGQQENICTSVTQRPQPVIILLSCIHVKGVGLKKKKTNKNQISNSSC